MLIQSAANCQDGLILAFYIRARLIIMIGLVADRFGCFNRRARSARTVSFRL
jgi:hypothetical protein